MFGVVVYFYAAQIKFVGHMQKVKFAQGNCSFFSAIKYPFFQDNPGKPAPERLNQSGFS